MAKKWTKLSGGMTWDIVRRIMRDKKRKEKFVNNLKYGKEIPRNTTCDTGPK